MTIPSTRKSCAQIFGHYTQAVWEHTTDLGCGIANCSNGALVVCRYGPAGNFLGNAPYGASTGACLDLDNDDVLQQEDANDQDRGVQ